MWHKSGRPPLSVSTVEMSGCQSYDRTAEQDLWRQVLEVPEVFIWLKSALIPDSNLSSSTLGCPHCHKPAVLVHVGSVKSPEALDPDGSRGGASALPVCPVPPTLKYSLS